MTYPLPGMFIGVLVIGWVDHPAPATVIHVGYREVRSYSVQVTCP